VFESNSGGGRTVFSIRSGKNVALRKLKQIGENTKLVSSGYDIKSGKNVIGVALQKPQQKGVERTKMGVGAQ